MNFLNPTTQVFNRNGEVFRPKVRIFLAPKFNSVGRRVNYSALLHYWTEVDVFEADPSELWYYCCCSIYIFVIMQFLLLSLLIFV